MKTALFDRHVALGAKIVDFGGWEMPLHYSRGTLYEHQAVRENVGIFDVSHMGQIRIQGPEAEKLMDHISTNQIAGKRDGVATYTVWGSESGGSVDDVIVYRVSATDFFVVVNAGNREKDLEHLKQVAENFDVVIQPKYDDAGIIAIQGAKAKGIIQELIPETASLKFMRLGEMNFRQHKVMVASSGYTGEPGCEVIADNKVITEVWDALVQLGAEPIGLGARDTLRLEMGFALYGHELSDTIAPSESVSAWTVRLTKGSFVGKAKLEELELSSEKRSQMGVVLTERGIAREGCAVYRGEKQIGVVTSGNQSPSLGKAIAIIMVNETLGPGDRVTIEIRNKRVQAEVVKMPFVTSVCNKLK